MAFLSPKKFKWWTWRRRDAYVNVFESEDGQFVLNDLINHCGWSKDLFNENPYVTANLTGRRHAILHIKAVLRMTDEQIEKIIDKFKDQGKD